MAIKTKEQLEHILAGIDKMARLREEQMRLLAKLRMLVLIEMQGIDPEQIASIGWSGRYWTDQRRDQWCREQAKATALSAYYWREHSNRIWKTHANFARLKDGTEKELNPIVPKGGDHG